MKVYGALESAQIEWFTNAGKPSPTSYPFRVIWVTDLKQVQVSDGSQWIAVGSASGGSIQWVESVLSPLPSVDNNIQVYGYEASLSQSVYALVRVPNSYASGSPINLRTTFYSSDTTGTGLIQTVSTLIRAGVDAITSTTNQRTSTNTAVSLSVSTVNIPQSIVCDISSSTGTINSIQVSAGDLLLISLTRGTDTSTQEIKVPVYGAEITFG